MTMIGLDATIAGIREARAEREARREDLLAQAASLKGEIRQLEQAERALTGNGTPRGNGDGNGNGRRNGSAIEAVETFMRAQGTATQSEVAKMLDRPKNTAKHALKVLTERGVVEPTGALIDRSPQYVLVAGQ
jgi:Fic family protein